MELQLPILLGAIAIILVTFSSRRLGAPAPLLLVLVGVLVSFLPWVGEIKLDPELVLAGILPPLLYSGAVNIPVMGFRRNFRPIAGLSVLLVILTSISVGMLLSWVVPDIDLATGIALAAIISPTDAVATTLVRRVGAPERLVTMLEGESLLNDASALVILRSAVVAIAGSVSLGWVAVDFVWAVVGAVIIGLIVGQISLRLRSHLTDPVLNTAVSFVIPFAAYLPAEHLGASGLVSAVLAGLVYNGQFAPVFLTPQERRAEEWNWRTIEFLLEGSIFLLMGLELSGLVSDLGDSGGSVRQAVWLGAVALAAVLAVRSLYLAGLIFGQRRERALLPEQRQLLVDRREMLHAQGIDSLATGQRKPARTRIMHALAFRSIPREERSARFQRFIDARIADVDYLIAEPIGNREGALLVWAGMRGAVTLAAAQSLPRDTPQRALLVLIAFVVATASLLVQGGSLPWLTRRLGLAHAGESELQMAERVGLAQRLAVVADQVCDDPELLRPNGAPYSERIQHRVCSEGHRAGDMLSDPEMAFVQFPELRIRILRAQRIALLDLRDEGLYSTGALNDAMAILDSEEIALSIRESAYGRVAE